MGDKKKKGNGSKLASMLGVQNSQIDEAKKKAQAVEAEADAYEDDDDDEEEDEDDIVLTPEAQTKPLPSKPSPVDVLEADMDDLDEHVDEADEASVLTKAFIDMLFEQDRMGTHQQIARFTLTRLKPYHDELVEWFSKSDPADFKTYAQAKENVFQYLISQYTAFDSQRVWADLIAHQFVTSLGLRPTR